MKQIFYSFFALILVSNCTDNSLPKPSGYLRLEYPEHSYSHYNSTCKYSFDYSKTAQLNIKDSCWIDIKYPKMNGTIYLTYYPVRNNLKEQIKQAEKIVYDHSIKASDIKPKIFTNPSKKTYGTLYSLGGEAATNIQFYVTDSTKHFLVGSVFFKTRPKADSLQPAIQYIQKDVEKLIETLQWN